MLIHVCVDTRIMCATIDVLYLLTCTGWDNELLSAFAPALQLTPLHTSLPNDISLPNWLVRRSYTAVFIFRYVCTVNSYRWGYRHPVGNEWNQLHSEICVIAPVIVTALRVLTALILTDKSTVRALRGRIILLWELHQIWVHFDKHFGKYNKNYLSLQMVD